jgi:hypothetical protein
MSKSLSFLSLAAALAVASGCVVNDGDDDGGDDTTSNGSNGDTSPDPTDPDPTDPDPTDPDPTDPGTDTGEPPADSSGTAGPADSTGAPADTGSEGGSETAGPSGNCGWGDTGQKRVPMGYICGGDGEDPEAMYPLACPEKTELMEGAECGMIRGQGCCDPNGDVWYCAQDGGEPVLFTDSCEK